MWFSHEVDDSIHWEQLRGWTQLDAEEQAAVLDNYPEDQWEWWEIANARFFRVGEGLAMMDVCGPTQ